MRLCTDERIWKIWWTDGSSGRGTKKELIYIPMPRCGEKQLGKSCCPRFPLSEEPHGLGPGEVMSVGFEVNFNDV